MRRENRLQTFQPGVAEGVLVGGNLSLIASLVGTPYLPGFRDKILFLEDVYEAPYSIDRMLTQLWLAGVLDEIMGLQFSVSSRTRKTAITPLASKRCCGSARGQGRPACAGS